MCIRDSSYRYRVLGERTDRWIRQTDFSNDEAVGYLSDRLARAGIEVELAKAGATAGSEVVIGEGTNAVVFDWQPTIGDLHQGPRGTDNRLYDQHRPNADKRLAEHRKRQWGTGQTPTDGTLADSDVEADLSDINAVHDESLDAIETDA